MTVWVLRNNRFVVKCKSEPRFTPGFPLPHVSRIEPFESPVTGREITSWRERDRDMAAVGACDPRDLARAPFEKREKDNARNYDSIWTDLN